MNKKMVKYGLLVLLIIGITYVVQNRDLINVEALETWVKDAGAAGPFLFMLIYIIGTIFFVPGSILTLAGGALFGPVWGTFYNLTGATIGAIISFIAARYIGRDWVEKQSGDRMKALSEGVEADGWRYVAFVRLVPLFPFNILNYALGLTKIKLSHYSIATYVCMFPGAVAYTYLGYVGREAVAGDQDIIQKILIGVSLLATVSLLPGIMKKLRAKPTVDVDELKEKLDARKSETRKSDAKKLDARKSDTGEDFLLLDVRTQQEYSGEQGHIEGSVMIPLEELSMRIKEISAYADKAVLTICQTDKRSEKAAYLLAQKGFTDARVVKHGMTAWNNKGYTTVK